MKKIFLLLFLLPLVAQAQPFERSKVVYVDTSGGKTVSKDELFNRLQLWFAETYNNSQRVIQLSDKEQGIISGKALFTYASGPQEHVVKYSIKVTVKDSRYKCDISDFEDSEYSIVTTQSDLPERFKGIAFNYHQRHWRELQIKCENEADALISHLRFKMEMPTTQKENW